MEQPGVVYYKIDYDEVTQIYTGYCPSMKPVMFSGKDKSEVNKLVQDGIAVFLEKNPNFFDTFEELKR